MKPIYPLTQPFEKLPKELPIFPLENALLPGGELPLTIFKPAELSMFIDVLRTDQLIGIVQPKGKSLDGDIYTIGCAGRIRQYRERKDGRLNIMLTGICRYRVVKELPLTKAYRRIIADWSDYERDYEIEEVVTQKIDVFKIRLRNYFRSRKMQVDWDKLNKLPVEELINNLVLVLNLSVDSKQLLLESPTVGSRLDLFSNLLDKKSTPIWGADYESKHVN